jgi:hypothetical protein
MLLWVPKPEQDAGAPLQPQKLVAVHHSAVCVCDCVQGCSKWASAQTRFTTCCRLQPTFKAILTLQALCVLFSAAFATLVVVAAWKRSHRLHTLLVRCAAWCALAALLLNLAALTTYAASACFHPNEWTFAGHSDTTAWAFGAGPFLCVLCSGLDGVAALPLLSWRVIRKVRDCRLLLPATLLSGGLGANTQRH